MKQARLFSLFPCAAVSQALTYSSTWKMLAFILSMDQPPPYPTEPCTFTFIVLEMTIYVYIKIQGIHLVLIYGIYSLS